MATQRKCHGVMRSVSILELSRISTRADVILNVQHDRGRPIARTGGGGLELLDNSIELGIRATIPETRDGDDALKLVNKRILRGSVGRVSTGRSSGEKGSVSLFPRQI